MLLLLNHFIANEFSLRQTAVLLLHHHELLSFVAVFGYVFESGTHVCVRKHSAHLAKLISEVQLLVEAELGLQI